MMLYDNPLSFHHLSIGKTSINSNNCETITKILIQSINYKFSKAYNKPYVSTNTEVLFKAILEKPDTILTKKGFFKRHCTNCDEIVKKTEMELSSFFKVAFDGYVAFERQTSEIIYNNEDRYFFEADLVIIKIKITNKLLEDISSVFFNEAKQFKNHLENNKHDLLEKVCWLYTSDKRRLGVDDYGKGSLAVYENLISIDCCPKPRITSLYRDLSMSNLYDATKLFGLGLAIIEILFIGKLDKTIYSVECGYVHDDDIRYTGWEFKLTYSFQQKVKLNSWD